MCAIVVKCQNADMAKLADATDLGSGSERSEGSSPFIRIKIFIVKHTTPLIVGGVFFMWLDTQSELKTLTYFYRS